MSLSRRMVPRAADPKSESSCTPYCPQISASLLSSTSIGPRVIMMSLFLLCMTQSTPLMHDAEHATAGRAMIPGLMVGAAELEPAFLCLEGRYSIPYFH